ncbi:MAG: sodium:solute symporter family protein [Candidatus Acidiferrales bacterium]
MNFTLLDWTAILGYLAITLLLGLYFRRRSGTSTEDYFVSGRDVPWWLAGTSMVATTFAADTPLLVAGLVYTQGVAGNWIWWAFLPSGMMTVFLFARLWRRSGLMTDVQFAEMRYAGKPAAFLRGFRAIYLGLMMNCLILGWVTKAMINIVGTTLGPTMEHWRLLTWASGTLTSIFGPVFTGTDGRALIICIFFLIPFTGIYVSLGGLWGVLWTDLFQFVLKMGIVIVVAYYGVKAAGGMSTMIGKIEAMRAINGGSDPLAFLPDFSRGFATEALWTLPVITFVVYLGLQWWAFWYPGAEPGGGGYVAQRIFSARDERQGLLSVLWFNIAHYALRPWPWIFTALAALVLYPGLAHPETSYMLIVNEHVPHALRGIILAGFLAAFMSTIATQLNWGSSYLVEDFYRRFIKRHATEGHYVRVSQVVTILLVIATGYVSGQLASIRSGWQVVLQVGAGTGSVYLLRWYWWRINAWSEISAMTAALVSTIAMNSETLSRALYHRAQFFSGSSSVIFAKTAMVTTATTTVVWVIVTLATQPEPDGILLSFYRKVRPQVTGWRRIAALAPEIARTNDLGRNLWCWVLGCIMVYSALFGFGKLLLYHWTSGTVLMVLAIVSAWRMSRELNKGFAADA